jgi:hypothetical protein
MPPTGLPRRPALQRLLGASAAMQQVRSLVENLARSMITGYKQGDAEQGITRAHVGLGALLLVVVAAFWIWYAAAGLP